jgi:uroporphyrinogen decarboxylase
VDHEWDLREAFARFPRGFVQGNFDPALLLLESDELRNRLLKFLTPLAVDAHPGWICGLGHGVLPNTPEENVRLFVNTVREVLA